MSFRSWAARCFLSIVDRGWFGLRPLAEHVVICGFPRSGTTLLNSMLAACFPEAKVFEEELRALSAAQKRRNHSLLISKQPADLFRIDQIRDYYRGRKASVKFLVTYRDPRAVLCSKWGDEAEYYMSPSRWRRFYEAFASLKPSEDLSFVNYEELVESPDSFIPVFARITSETMSAVPSEYYKCLPRGFEPSASQGGIRAPDARRISAWLVASHDRRVRQILQEIDDLPEILVKMGYENSYDWLRRYRDIRQV